MFIGIIGEETMCLIVPIIKYLFLVFLT